MAVKMRTAPRQPYTAPRLRVLGSVARLTRSAPPQKLHDGQYSNGTSDVAWKHLLGPADPSATLQALASLRLLSWRYRDEPEGIRHVGPTAQEFHAAFGVGGDDRVIDAIDSGGVLMAAVQALAAEVVAQRAELAAQRAEIDRLAAEAGRRGGAG